MSELQLLSSKGALFSPDDVGTFSERLWELRWKDLLPLRLRNAAVCVDLRDYSTIKEFADREFPQIYPRSTWERFTGELARRSKDRFYSGMADCLSLETAGNCIGIFIGMPGDWSSYYIRNVSLTPTHQGKGLYQEFLTKLLPFLGKAGVERIEVDVSPNNLRHIHVLNKFGFLVTGNGLSERWGATLRFTKLLSPASEKAFLRQSSPCSFERGPALPD